MYHPVPKLISAETPAQARKTTAARRRTSFLQHRSYARRRTPKHRHTREHSLMRTAAKLVTRGRCQYEKEGRKTELEKKKKTHEGEGQENEKPYTRTQELQRTEPRARRSDQKKNCLCFLRHSLRSPSFSFFISCELSVQSRVTLFCSFSFSLSFFSLSLAVVCFFTPESDHRWQRPCRRQQPRRHQRSGRCSRCSAECPHSSA